jgi:hypothetical protein
VAAATEEKIGDRTRALGGVGIHAKQRSRLKARLGKTVQHVLREPAFRWRAEALRDEYQRYKGPAASCRTYRRSDRTTVSDRASRPPRLTSRPRGG